MKEEINFRLSFFFISLFSPRGDDGDHPAALLGGISNAGEGEGNAGGLEVEEAVEGGRREEGSEAEESSGRPFFEEGRCCCCCCCCC